MKGEEPHWRVRMGAPRVPDERRGGRRYTMYTTASNVRARAARAEATATMRVIVGVLSLRKRRWRAAKGAVKY